jgi:hypothetical protein
VVVGVMEGCPLKAPLTPLYITILETSPRVSSNRRPVHPISGPRSNEVVEQGTGVVNP